MKSLGEGRESAEVQRGAIVLAFAGGIASDGEKMEQVRCRGVLRWMSNELGDRKDLCRQRVSSELAWKG